MIDHFYAFSLITLLSVIGSLESLKGQESNVNDYFSPQCYCAGHDYASIIPELAQAISKMFREESRAADVYRVPVTRQSKLPRSVGFLNI